MMTSTYNRRLLEAQEFFFMALFIIPVFIPYFRDELGLTFQDFLIGETVFAIVMVAFEVPSGWLSDVWKRKYVLTLAHILWLLGGVIFLIAQNLEMTLVAQAFWGISMSLKSGTDSALLYDSLYEDDRTNAFTRLEGRRRGYAMYMAAFAFAVGGFLYEIDADLPLYAMIGFNFVGVFLTVLIREPDRHKEPVEKHPLADMLETMRYAIAGHRTVAGIIVFSALLFSATKVIMWTQQPYYIGLGLPESVFGLLMAVGAGLGGVASHMAHFLETKLAYFKSMVLGWLVALIVCLGAAHYIGYIGVALLMIGGTFVFGAIYPMVVGAINDRVDSSRRATILSTASLAKELVFVPLGLLAGWLSTHYGGVVSVLNGLAIWLLLAGLGLALWRRKK